MGPFVHPSSPFDIRLADEFRKAMVRCEELSAIVLQGKERPVEIVEQKRASLELAVQQRLQSSRRIREVAS